MSGSQGSLEAEHVLKSYDFIYIVNKGMSQIKSDITARKGHNFVNFASNHMLKSLFLLKHYILQY